MLEYFPFYLGLVVVILLLIMLADKIKVAYPVLLVLAGVLISFVPGIPTLEIKPELIFVIFLPPILYEAAWSNSWKELWHWRRIISSFAVVVVFFTAVSVALVANWFVPGFSLAIGLLLGGIVSPPDAVSAGAILKFVKVPKRMSSILEGESLLNDASSLIIFRFAMIAVATGQFIWYNAALSFVWMVTGGVLMGLLVGFIFIKIHKLLPTDANMDIILTLVTPYAIYIAAEEVHASGVLAVVAGGLFLSYHRHSFLTSSSRLRSENVWQSMVFLLNGLVFLLIGLDLPEITNGLKTEGVGFYEATLYGLIITGVLILGRMIAAYGAVVTTWIAGHFITVADKSPGLKAPLALGWAGMRGVVSLAAALSIPVTLSDGSAFPHRNLILYITFVVILATLVLQGLTLPWLIKKINFPTFNDHLSEEETEDYLKQELSKVSLGYLEECAGKAISDDCLNDMVLYWKDYYDVNNTHDSEIDVRIQREIFERQRLQLISINKTSRNINEEIIRKFLKQIDLEEEKFKITQ